MKKVKVIVVRSPGANCDIETAHAFEKVGAVAKRVHINELTSGRDSIFNYDILAIPGGFSYGDDIAGGKILSVHMNKFFKDIKKFIADKKPVIGICNGFQVLTRLGFLPTSKSFEHTTSLDFNDSGTFICKWVNLKVNKKSPCIFTKGLPDYIQLPIAHGEGKLVVKNKAVLQEIKKNNADALTYEQNPNGSLGDIAGLTNKDGNVLGLMPHPERFTERFHHPAWTRDEVAEFLGTPAGLMIFKNAVKYVK